MILAATSLVACGGSGQGDTRGTGAGISDSANPDTEDPPGSDEGNDPSADESGETEASNDTEADAEFVEVRIEPEAPFLEVIDGVTPDPIHMKAFGVTEDGDEVEIMGVWNIDRLDVASVDASTGELRASGIAGGIVPLTFQSSNGDAEVMATVKLHIHDDGGVDDSVKDMFGDGDAPDPTLALLYPYTDTVFPRDLVAPVVQWGGSTAADTMYFHLDSPTFEYEAWVTGVDPGRYTILVEPIDVWEKLTASVVDDDIDVSLQRYDGTTVYQPVTSSWHIADAELIGTIYYWEVNNGNVVRLKVGDPAPETFLQKPPGVDCVACHSVSANGQTMVAAFHGGYSPWGTFDTTNGASLYATDSSSGFEAISPEGDFIVWGQTNGVAQLSAFNSIDVLATLTVPAGGFPAFPAWSPDGARLAYTVRIDGNWLDFNNSSLYVSDVDMVTPAFSNEVQLVTPTAGRTTVVYPTWSPDSQWIAYGRATQARTRGALGELGISSSDGATHLMLDRSCGVGTLSADQSSACYEPTFMPESRGGYFWLVFVSERTYGNTLVDTDPTTRHKQLWITAIDDPPVPGQDPSHPAFWLPGQEINNQNMRGAWTLEPDEVEG